MDDDDDDDWNGGYLGTTERNKKYPQLAARCHYPWASCLARVQKSVPITAAAACSCRHRCWQGGRRSVLHSFMNRLVTHLCQATSATYLPAVTQFRLKLAIPAVLEEQCVRCRCNAHIIIICDKKWHLWILFASCINIIFNKLRQRSACTIFYATFENKMALKTNNQNWHRLN